MSIDGVLTGWREDEALPRDEMMREGPAVGSDEERWMIGAECVEDTPERWGNLPGTTRVVDESTSR